MELDNLQSNKGGEIGNQREIKVIVRSKTLVIDGRSVRAIVGQVVGKWFNVKRNTLRKTQTQLLTEHSAFASGWGSEIGN